MAPRRLAPSANSLSPQEPSPLGQNPALHTFPRSTSPSVGFTQFLSKPKQWFSRSSPSPRLSNAGTDSRGAVNAVRKNKISRPQDPRPLVESMQPGANMGIGSKSVVDLPLTRTPNSFDMYALPSHNTPSAPSSPRRPGDLRNIATKGWSRSVDDLSNVSTPNLTPIKTTFHEKVVQYRERTSSNASSRSPAPTTPSPVTTRQAWPTVSQSPLSSSPPSMVHHSPSAPSISISAPDTGDVPSQNGIYMQHQPAHIRSQSFGPRLASKLSNPKIGPPSPKRKGSAPTSEIERDTNALKDRRPSISNKPTAAVSRAPFPFGFSSPTQKPLPLSPANPPNHPTPPNEAPDRSTMLMAAPTIIEPHQDGKSRKSEQRLSQLVHHSGFINRLTPDSLLSAYTHTHQSSVLTMNKNWKPYKLEVKGTKLYFYKPPGDRASAMKELFPSEFVPAGRDDDDEGNSDLEAADAGGKPSKPTEGEDSTLRKQRVFWGRRTHPDLVRGDDGKIERGTFEALVHEAVFGTTFLTPPGDDAEVAESSPEKRLEDWKDFASAILLCMPSLIGVAKFEGEFIRCCSYLVSGAEEPVREEERSRVVWLAAEYLRGHGEPRDASAWEEWRAGTIPQFYSTGAQAVHTIPTSSSMQGLLLPSPQVGTSTPSSLSQSPNLAMFSPRPPDDPKMASLMEALGGPDSSPGKRSLDVRHLYPNVQVPWAKLEQEGLSREVLLTLDPHFIARSLCIFHRGILEQIPDNLTVEFIVTPAENDPSSSPSSSSADVPNPATPASMALFGSDEHPHWLTKLLLLQILGPSSPQGGNRDDERQTSRTHSRSQVISAWVKIGELCRLSGDECSWRAIVVALCSQPVARLEKAWRRVDMNALTAVQNWVRPKLDGERLTVKEPRVTPWGGDKKHHANEELENAKGQCGDGRWNTEPLFKVRDIFEELRTSFSLCFRKSNITDTDIGEDVRRMASFWNEMFAGRAGSAMTFKWTRIDQFMSLSLAAEPRRKGLFEPHYWSRTTASSQACRNILIPLMFPEPLPYVTLIDRDKILRSRVEPETTANELPFIRSIDMSLRFDEHGARVLPSGVGGTIIPVHNGDLLLMVQPGDESQSASQASSRAPSQPSSRPPSSIIDISLDKSLGRSPSLRVKTGSSHTLDRKSSVARRSSLPSISQRESLSITPSSLERPLRVTVQAGSLNCLVNVLVHGLQNVSVAVADDNGELPLRESKIRDLIVDRDEFAKVWWRVFRSFISPLVFFELLRKIYISSQPAGRVPLVDECLKVARRRGEIIDTIKEWLEIGGGAQDILDDMELHDAFRLFLNSPTDHVVHRSPSFAESTVQQAWSALEQSRQILTVLLSSQTMSPSTRTIHTEKHSASSARVRNFGRDTPDIDHVDAEELVDNLDSIASAVISNVTEEDLFVTSDVLEAQTADRTGWLLTREPPAAYDDFAEIQTMYSHVQEVETSSTISGLSQDAVYRVLPPGVRSCIRAYGILRRWLISKIIAFKVGLRTRQQRMELLLRAVEVTRLRSADSGPTHSRLVERPCIRSFVEAALTSAIVSTESRIFHRAWQNVAASRGVHCDALTSLLANPCVKSTNSKSPLTVDTSWFLERLMEVLCNPDVMETSSTEGQNLINFEKRRQIYQLIRTGPNFNASQGSRSRSDGERRDYERLNNMEKEANRLHFDHRTLKEEAHREAAQASISGSSSARKGVRPFQRLAITQVEKNRRDRSLRDKLIKEKRLEQQRNDRRDDVLNKAMRGRKAPTGPQKHRPRKSMSVLFQFMRPISTAFADGSPAIKRTPQELDFAPTGKPFTVISLAAAKVAQFINNDRSFTFQLDTEEGGHYLLQAINKRDMVMWIDNISRVSKDAAKRRLTYVGNSPKPQLSDHIHNRPLTTSHDPTAVFGVDLQFLLKREALGGEVQPGAIPSMIEQCLSEIERRGLTEVGIYRIAGATTEINALKDSFNKGQSPINDSTDIHALCDVVKSWFRVLPEPVFPSSSYHEVIQAMKIQAFDERFARIRAVVRSLPPANLDLLKRVAEHLDRVTDFEQDNQMTAEALAIVFSPNLLRAPHNDFAMILANMGSTHQLVKAIITHPRIIFDDPDPEPEADQDEEDFDAAILEEDEDENNLSSSESSDHDNQ